VLQLNNLKTMPVQGLYNIDPSMTDQKSASYVEAGIRTNLEMKKVVYQTTEKSEFLAFYFENENGDKLSHTEWPTKLSRPIEYMSDEEKERAIGLIKRQASLVAQIVESILGKGTFSNIKADSFKDLAEQAVKVLGNKFIGIKLRAKVVYDYRGFTSLANNPKFTFIEPMTISDADTKIRILDNDKIVRPPQKSEEKHVENPLETSSTAPAGKGDLPF
jgi:hypothetical protein